MIFARDLGTVLLGVGVLLALALHTLIKCRKELPMASGRSAEAHWFAGLSKSQSMGAALGSAFSVTYLGAAVIYGHIFKGWYIVFLFSALPALLWWVRFVIKSAYRELPSDIVAAEEKHLLFELLKVKLTPSSFQSALLSLTLIYFFLLVEELAVARLVLEQAFPGVPLVPALVISTLCIVVIVYLRWGGYQAVLLSDFEQLKLMLPFVLALGFLVGGKNQKVNFSQDFFPVYPETSPSHFLVAILLIVAWVGIAPDFYARLNFKIPNQANSQEQHLQFATLAVCLFWLFLLFVGTFGMLLPDSFSEEMTPAGFTSKGIAILISQGTTTTSVIFFAGFFFMLFTTIDTLLCTLVQMLFLQASPLASRKRLSSVLLAAVLFSCAQWGDSVSAIGIFVGALLIIPFLLTVFAMIGNKRTYWELRRFPELAIFLSVIGFVVTYRDVEAAFKGHLAIAQLVVTCSILAVIASIALGYAQRRLRK